MCDIMITTNMSAYSASSFFFKRISFLLLSISTTIMLQAASLPTCATLLVSILLAGFSSVQAGGRKAQIDISPNLVVNPDPEATGIVEDEFRGEAEEGETLIGDMIVPEDDEGDRNAAADEDKMWPRGVVPYRFHMSVPSYMREKIHEAIADFHDKTCVQFVPRTDEHDYVEFITPEKGCLSSWGRWGGKQRIKLAERCNVKGTIIHEMLHALGFKHEHVRNDRDNYVTVNFDVISEAKHRQYEKIDLDKENNMNLPYDYSSVLHYPARRRGGKLTIVTKDPKDQNKIGQRAGFSFQDVIEVNTYYKCENGESGVGGTNGCNDKMTTVSCKRVQRNGMCRKKEVREVSCRRSCQAC